MHYPRLGFFMVCPAFVQQVKRPKMKVIACDKHEACRKGFSDSVPL